MNDSMDGTKSGVADWLGRGSCGGEEDFVCLFYRRDDGFNICSTSKNVHFSILV